MDISSKGVHALIVRARSPTRISFGGGGTDISPYKERYGGLVLSATIDRYAYCTVEKSKKFVSGSPFTDAAVKLLRDPAKPISVSHFTEAPAGSGLGGSSSLMVAVIKAVSVYYEQRLSCHQIAEMAYKAEREILGLKGGYQDQFAAAYGGFNLMEFTNSVTKVVRLNIGDDMMRELLASLILVNLGESRLSSDIISRQMASYAKEPTQVMDALNKMKDITRQMVVRVLAGDVKELGILLSEEWALKKTLDKRISNSVIDRFHATMISHGAIGGKLCGAGEGGHILFLSDLSQRAKLLEFVKESGFHYVPFNFDSQGVQAWSV